MGVEEQRDNNVGGVTGKGFLPGRSGNPGGRPKGRSITARLREMLDAPAVGEDGNPLEGLTIGDQVVAAILSAAVAGDPRLIRELIDRTEGKARPAAERTEDVDARRALLCEAEGHIEEARRGDGPIENPGDRGA